MPRILIFDIETKPLLGWAWGLFDQNIAVNQIHTDWSILSWAAKWLDEKKVFYEDLRGQKNIDDDKKILRGIWKLLDEADIVVTQNGKAFDQKKLNARFVLNGFPPPSSFKHYDTKQIAARHFSFTSNRLEYLSKKLCQQKKSEHKKYHGFELWSECIKGNMSAWKEMEKYNKQDVLATEELYKKLTPWSKDINFNIYNDKFETKCNCGGNLARNGYSYTDSGKYQRYKCKTCGRERRGSTNLLTKTKRGSLLK